MCVFSSSAAVVLEAAIAEEVVVTKRHSYVGRGENKIERVGKVGGGREEKRREGRACDSCCFAAGGGPLPPSPARLRALTLMLNSRGVCQARSLSCFFPTVLVSSLFSSETFRGRKKGSENDRSTNLNFFWSG